MKVFDLIPVQTIDKGDGLKLYHSHIVCDGRNVVVSTMNDKFNGYYEVAVFPEGKDGEPDFEHDDIQSGERWYHDSEQVKTIEKEFPEYSAQQAIHLLNTWVLGMREKGILFSRQHTIYSVLYTLAFNDFQYLK